MKVSITENKLLNVMIKFAEKHFPQVLKPLKTKLKLIGKGNSGWGSSMHDYNIYTTEYRTEDGYLVLVENDSHNRGSNFSRWELSESLEPFYDFFGEESVEMFFEQIHKVDLKNKGNFTNNWVFGVEPFET